MYEFIFNTTDDGKQGKAFEMAIKQALKRRNPNRISPCGYSDFRYKNHCYDVKQNGTVIKYGDFSDKYIKGSSRVIYATHIACDVTDNGDGTTTVVVDLDNTTFFVVDRNEFVEFLISTGKVKVNSSRNTINIQTCYNYKKNAYHGRLGKIIEGWCFDNALDDEIVFEIK
jgi:hypothetical protein